MADLRVMDDLRTTAGTFAILLNSDACPLDIKKLLVDSLITEYVEKMHKAIGNLIDLTWDRGATEEEEEKEQLRSIQSALATLLVIRSSVSFSESSGAVHAVAGAGAASGTGVGDRALSSLLAVHGTFSTSDRNLKSG